MAKFTIDFFVQGSGEVEFPVTPLDDLLVLINGMEIKTFRFTVLNTLDTPLDFSVAASKVGNAADKIDVSFDSAVYTLQPGVETLITSTITPLVALYDGDQVDINVLGTQL